MVTIKIEIGFDKARDNAEKEFDIRKAAWLAALVDSMIWLAFGAFTLNLFYGTARYPHALSLGIVIFFTYLFYFILKTWFLIKKYGRSVYRDEFGNTGLLLVAVSVAVLLMQCFFLR